MKSKKSKTKTPIARHLHRTIKKSTWMAREVVKFTRIPEAYSETVAWFAERIILAGICIATAAFAGGVLYTLYLAEPIADSSTYLYLSDHAAVAREQFIDFTSPVFTKLLVDNYFSDKLETKKRKQQIKDYLVTKESPFAQDDAALTALAGAKNMKMILAISFVESNFGKHCYYYNCSGIGGANLKKYHSYAEWITDFDQLLTNRYQGLPPEKFLGVYVQPGSPNWLYGVRQVLQEFKDQQIT